MLSPCEPIDEYNKVGVLSCCFHLIHLVLLIFDTEVAQWFAWSIFASNSDRRNSRQQSASFA
jgi:NADH:ubiquinone oxidoreductase subunit 3 (subunit A)